MVYCGPPSKGCQTCRERKIRCDQRPGRCVRCAKSRRECPGYRDLSDLMFRNESTDVIRKAKAKATSKSRSGSPGPNSSKPLPPPRTSPEQNIEKFLILVPRNDTPATQPAISYYSMAPTIDERATGFFFTNYIIEANSHSGNSAGYRIDENLLICMKAVGLAGLSSAAHAPGLVQEVRGFEVAFLDSVFLLKFRMPRPGNKLWPDFACYTDLQTWPLAIPCWPLFV